jgi:citrate synthase
MAEECTPTVNTGLRGVTVATTRISDVDGGAGKLIYRGYLVKDLAESATFEEIVFLLFYERLPTGDELVSFRNELAAERAIPQAVIDMMKLMPADALPMDVLQAAVGALAQYDPDTGDDSREGALRMGTRLVARLTTVLAAWDRIRNGKKPVDPDPSLSHAANFLYMLTGEVPKTDVARFFDVCLILHAEHSFQRVDLFRPPDRLHARPYVCRHRGCHRLPVGRTAWRRQCPRHGNAPENRCGGQCGRLHHRGA